VLVKADRLTGVPVSSVEGQELLLSPPPIPRGRRPRHWLIEGLLSQARDSWQCGPRVDSRQRRRLPESSLQTVEMPGSRGWPKPPEAGVRQALDQLHLFTVGSTMGLICSGVSCLVVRLASRNKPMPAATATPESTLIPCRNQTAPTKRKDRRRYSTRSSLFLPALQINTHPITSGYVDRQQEQLFPLDPDRLKAFLRRSFQVSGDAARRLSDQPSTSGLCL
jgi:hypothetical protein